MSVVDLTIVGPFLSVLSYAANKLVIIYLVCPQQQEHHNVRTTCEPAQHVHPQQNGL